jgi:hypothetical protein
LFNDASKDDAFFLRYLKKKIQNPIQIQIQNWHFVVILAVEKHFTAKIDAF